MNAPRGLLAVLSVVLAGSCDRRPGHLVYGPQDFSDVPLEPEAIDLPEWSARSIEDTPGTPSHPRDRFLGQFGRPDGVKECDEVKLSLEQLPVHTWVRLSFDLHVIRTWDGNDSNGFGPDVFTVDVTGGPRLVETTFSNVRFTRGGSLIAKNQSFPDGVSGGENPLQTGAAEANTLGYTADVSGVGALPMDSVYCLELEFEHRGDSMELVFAAPNLQPMFDESWGLDDVELFVFEGRDGWIGGTLAIIVVLVAGLLSLTLVAARRKRTRLEP